MRFWVMMISSLSVCVFPLLLQFDYWQSKLTGTIFNTPSIVETPKNFLIHFASNIIFAFYSFLYTMNPSHYVFSSYVDPLTGMLVLIGIPALLSILFRQKFIAFWMIAFALMVFFVGSSHDKVYPETTRMFLLLPFFAFFASIALAWFQVELRQMIGNKKIPKITIMIFIIVIIFLNTYQAYIKSPEYFTGQFEDNLLRTIENVEKNFTDNPKTFVIITSEGWGINLIQALQEVYGIPKKWDRIIGIDVSQINASDNTMDLIRQGSTFVLIRPVSDNLLQKNIEEQISSLGKKLCPITDRPGGNLQFEIWYPDGFDNICNK
jgi:hypothetical protein